ncbi:MAG: VTT domain-containing protein [Candidatus Pacebacteria bacterium]|nr:VTT domain-containing protein [Candidatus Paceibacterota bacterium]MCF7862566.1 VTT domain-containing protein [Candidatus Paceibacterota bacterium]
MEALLHIDLMELAKTAGYIGLFLIIFAESGLFFGFFLPGDSLLFTVGLLASQGFFNIWWVCALTILGAFIGDQVGYTFGNKIGPKIFKKEDSFWFKKEYIKKAENFYAQYGKKTIILARFIPVVRTFAPILAGVGNMPRKTFSAYNIIGALVWGGGVTLLGYFLGEWIPNIDKYLFPIILGIIFLSFVPAVFSFFKHK